LFDGEEMPSIKQPDLPSSPESGIVLPLETIGSTKPAGALT
jgi:hypothetical protein